jgi:hypothetical protein
MPFFAIGYTSFTNSAPVITGTNVIFASGSTWGNHTLEYQVDVGSGYGGTWLGLNAANLITHVFNSDTGFKLKFRATCLTASATNAITNIRIVLTTTSVDQQTKLYPLVTVPISVLILDQITGLPIENARVRITTTVGGNVVLNGVTNSSGILSGTTEYVGSSITGTARRASVAYGGLYKPSAISGTIQSTGFSSTVLLISDD